VKPGRNDPCVCGSGKKYKHCCARTEVRSTAASRDNVGELAAMAASGRYVEMETVARNLVEAHPSSGHAWKALGVSLHMQGKDALQAFEKATTTLPNDPEVHSNLGAELRRAGRFEEALAAFRRAIALRPDIAEVHNNIGNALKDLGRFAEAALAFRRALDLKPNFAKAHNNWGNTLRDQGAFDEAATCYGRAIALQPNYAEAHANLGILLRLQGRPVEAEISCRRALDINPNLSAAIVLLAEIRSDKGEFAAAEELFKCAVRLGPESAEALAGIAGLRRMTSRDTDWLAQAQRLAGQRLAPREESRLRYAIGKYFDDTANFEEAFVNYKRANELTKMLRPEHDRQQLSRTVDLIIDTFDKEWLLRARVDSNNSICPVFIVGMPRSGTTLAEQILASHPDVFGAGELPFWSAAVSDSATRGNGEIGQRTLRDWGGRYLEVLHESSNGVPRVVDKMPGNFLYLGLIHAALPNAKIIHMRRNPIDTCLSVYYQNFGAFHSYANDLGDLAHYYSDYSRLMDHWRLTLPTDAILDLPYEELVADPEIWSRKMVDFIGLPWDSSCLEFHRTDRTVSTFSKWQVRQTISRSSVERWRNYRHYVGPLLNLVESGRISS
jgi:Tfp pilus assembly protein PilF